MYRFKKNNFLSNLSDFDKNTLYYMINFKFAIYLKNQIENVKDNYFTQNILLFNDGKIYQSNYDQLKEMLKNNNTTSKTIKKIKKSQKLVLFDTYYEHIIEFEQGCIDSWIDTILRPGIYSKNKFEGLYYKELIKSLEENNKLKELNESLMKELDNEIKDNITLYNEIKQKKSLDIEIQDGITIESTYKKKEVISYDEFLFLPSAPEISILKLDDEEPGIEGYVQKQQETYDSEDIEEEYMIKQPKITRQKSKSNNFKTPGIVLC